MLCALHFRACQGGELWQRKIPRRPSNSRLTQCTQKFAKLVCLIPTALAKCCRAYGTAILLRSISWLRLKNGRGRNIYIRPSGEHRLSLIDDIGWRAVGRLKDEGFDPAVIVETSPGNFQAWLNHGVVFSKDLSTFAARLLARRF